MKIQKMKLTLISRCAFLLAILFCHFNVSEAGPGLYLEVAAGDQARQNCVVSIPLPELFKNQKHLTLFRLDNKQEIPVQIDQVGERKELVWILREPLPAGATRKYQILTGGAGNQQKEQVTVNDDGEHLHVKVDEKPVLTYNHAIVKAPKRDEAYYDKSGYIHPLYTPSGKVISDDFNPDHPHQHGIMLSWRKIIFEGRENNGCDQKSQ
ncbi:MAG: PmoA family protein, partial [Planctomycetaceae bacterium]|nr:PmoA family protein [Planctomycetaceae bacterium]